MKTIATRVVVKHSLSTISWINTAATSTVNVSRALIINKSFDSVHPELRKLLSSLFIKKKIILILSARVSSKMSKRRVYDCNRCTRSPYCFFSKIVFTFRYTAIVFASSWRVLSYGRCDIVQTRFTWDDYCWHCGGIKNKYKKMCIN